MGIVMFDETHGIPTRLLLDGILPVRRLCCALCRVDAVALTDCDICSFQSEGTDQRRFCDACATEHKRTEHPVEWKCSECAHEFRRPAPPPINSYQLTLCIICAKKLERGCCAECKEVMLDRNASILCCECKPDVDFCNRKCLMLHQSKFHYKPETTTSDELVCVVCQVNRKDTVIKPCRHLCVCWSCAAKINTETKSKCPICRCATTRFEHVYH